MPIILTRNFEGEVTEDFSGEMMRRVAGSKGSCDFIYIVPTRRRVRELQRELVGEIVFGRLPVYTLELFSREVYTKLNLGRKIISPSMQGMIVSEILAKDDFKFFRYLSSRHGGRKGVAPAGTIKRIVDQIDFLRENGIASEDYEKMLVAAEESERNKLSEFLRIYEGYEERLGGKLIDSAGLIALVNHEMARAPDFIDDNFQDDLTFFVEGFYNFKKPEMEFLKIFSSRKDFSFLVKLDCIDANEDLFKTMLATSSELIQRGFRKTEDVSGKSGLRGRKSTEDQNLRDYFAATLFAEESPRTKLDLHDKIFVTSVSDRLREVEFVAEKIKEIIKENPAQKLDGICVASYMPQDYSRFVREVFAKYRIPVNVTDRLTLESSSVVNAILSFIDVRLADYERSALLRAITNRLVVVSKNLTSSVAGSIIFDAARLCKFERGLKSFEEAITYRLELASKLSPEDLDEDETQIRRNIKTLNDARVILDSVEDKLAMLRSEMLPSEFRNAMNFLLKSLKVYDGIIKLDVGSVVTETVERDAKALTAFLNVVDEIVEIETEKGNREIDLDVWTEKLRSALLLTRYNIRQKYGYGVYVTSLEEIRGLEFDYMFILGLTEGELPKKYSPEIFLPLHSQRENRVMQPYLQRHLFYQAIGSFKKELYLVHALKSDDVRLIKSSFVDAVLDIVVCTELDDEKPREHSRNIYNIQQAIESSPEILERIRSEQMNLLPPNLERCKKAEASRFRDDRESEFHGKIKADDSIGILSDMFADRIFSSSQLESLARCGFQYFVRHVLRIGEVPDIETSLSAIERGAVLHKILFRFYNELSALGKLDNSRNELELLLGIGKKVLDELGINHDLFEVERDTILGTGSVKGTLELFLEKVQSKLSGYGFKPEVFELGFGMSQRASSGNGAKEEIPAVKIGEILLRGKIDRIDANQVGLTIFDYKTSSAIPAHKDVVGDKISPQLILYLDALNQLIIENKLKGNVAGAAFISINRYELLSAEDGEDLIKFIVQTDGAGVKYNPSFGSGRKLKAADQYPRSMDDLLKESEIFFNGKVSEAAAGRFNLTEFSYERVCTFCPYSEACRIGLRGNRYLTEESV